MGGWKLRRENSTRVVVFERFGGEEAGAGVLCARENFNCDCAGGSLKGGVGAVLRLNEAGEPIFINYGRNVLSVFEVKENTAQQVEDVNGRFALGADGVLYRLDDVGDIVKKGTIGANGVHVCIRKENRRICNVFAGKKGAIASWNGQGFVTIDNSGDLRGCIALGERVFLAGGSGKIRYSAVQTPTTLDGGSEEGGELYLPPNAGEIVGMQADGGYGYLFTDWKIFRLQAAGSPTDFRLEELAYGGGRICRASMVTNGNGIVFLSAEGVYRVCGRRVERICKHLSVLPAADVDCRVGYCEDLLMVDFARREGEKLLRYRLTVYADGTNGYLGDMFGTLGGNELCCVGGVLYSYKKDGVGVEHQRLPYFQTGELNLGTEKTKRLKKLRMRGSGRIRCVLTCGQTSHEYTRTLSGDEASLRLCEKGKRFSLRLYPDAGAELKGLEIEYACAE